MLVKIALPLILAFIMFSLGLGLTGKDFGHVAKFPKAFGMGLFNQLILLPVIAFGLIRVFGLSGEMAVGMMILSCCPGGVTTNVITRIINGNIPLSISLTASASLISIITVPILVAASVSYFMAADAPEVNVTKLGIQMFLITAIPVALGMLCTRFAPRWTETIMKPTSTAALVFFVVIILAALTKNWEVVWTNLPNLGPALATLNIALLLLAYASSLAIKLNKKDAATISIESGIQNGTLGIAVGSLIAVGSTATLPPTTVPAAVYGITMYVVSMPFVFWLRKRCTEG